jgi:hypothetical protein
MEFFYTIDAGSWAHRADPDLADDLLSALDALGAHGPVISSGAHG